LRFDRQDIWVDRHNFVPDKPDKKGFFAGLLDMFQ
jgi:hypothetical protein